MRLLTKSLGITSTKMKKKNKITIILAFMLLLIAFSFSGSYLISQTSDEEPSVKIESLVGGSQFKEVGNQSVTSFTVGDFINERFIITLEEKARCTLSMGDNTIKIVGPFVVRSKDIIEQFLSGNISRLKLDNVYINRVLNIYIKTNNSVFESDSKVSNSEKAQRTFHRIVKAKISGFYERAFKVACDFIEKYQNSTWAKNTKTNINAFYYLLSEIALETLNLDIAEASFYKVEHDIENGKNIKNVNSEKIFQQNILFIFSVVNTMRSKFTNSIDYLTMNITNYQKDSYFNERMAYLGNYLMGVNYLMLDMKKIAVEYFNNAVKSAGKSITLNMETLKDIYTSERTENTDKIISKYNSYLNEASFIINYSKKVIEELERQKSTK